MPPLLYPNVYYFIVMWMAMSNDPACELPSGKCEHRSCSLLPEVPKAQFVGDQPPGGVFAHEAVAEYACDEGHTADGLVLGPRRVLYRCHIGGNFRPVRVDITECKPVKCGAPFELPNAYPTSHKIGESVVYPQKVDYTCNEHTTANGEDDGPKTISIQCGSDGKFHPSYPLPRCQPIHCGEFPSIANAEPVKHVNPTRVAEGQSIDFVCLDGFTEQTMGFEVKCINIDGHVHWDVPLRSPCIARKCGQLERFDDAHQTHFGKNMTYRYPSKVPFACAPGYALGGDKTRHQFTAACTITGVWEYDRGSDRCEPVICGDINDVPKEMKQFATAVITTRILRLGERMDFACDEGAYVAGTNREHSTYTIQCSSSGDFQWAHGYTSGCIKPCGPLLPIKNGRLTYPQGVSPGDIVESPTTVVYMCSEGHTLGGRVEGEVKFEQQCHADGNLSPEAHPPPCELVKCGQAPEVPHGEVSQASGPKIFTYKDEVKYTCEEGTTHNGLAMAKGGKATLLITCGIHGWGIRDSDHGDWLSRLQPPLACTPPRCAQKLPDIVNAVPSTGYNAGDRLLLNDSVDYKCNLGYTPKKEGRRTGTISCSTEGDLEVTMDDFECVPLVCPLLPTIMYHGTLLGPAAREAYNATPRVYQCPDRWTPDKVLVQCGADGHYHTVGPNNFQIGDPQTTRYPMCQPPRCKASDIPTDWAHISIRSRQQTGDFISGTSYKVKCQQGFGTLKIANTLPVRCNDNSQWEIDGNPEEYSNDGVIGCTETFTGTGEYTPEIWPPPVLYS